MPDRLGKFEILRSLGRGAMGEVYLAKDAGLGRTVALKTIKAEVAATGLGDELRQRFAREAKAAALLHHPNVVTVFEFGEDQGLLFLAMEYVEGQDLASLLAEGSLQPTEILEIVAQLCEGLHAAHKQGIVHRDIKPSNVMVLKEDGHFQAKVLDFGVAKVAGGDLTQTGQVMGTLAYMAPEYLRTGEASPQSDLFSVGVLLHEALAGEKPFRGETTGAVVYNIIHDEPKSVDPSRLQGVSPAARQLVDRALQKDPALRFSSAADFARALRAAKHPGWTEDDATTALPRAMDVTKRTAQAPASRLPLIAGAALLLLAGLAYGLHILKPKAEVAVRPVEAGNVHVNDVVLDEAAKLADKDPAEALKLVQAVIDATPKELSVDPDAYAVKLVVLYKKGQQETFGETLAEARFRGVKAADLLTNKTYKAMLEKDKARRKLSTELRERLLKGQDD